MIPLPPNAVRFNGVISFECEHCGAHNEQPKASFYELPTMPPAHGAWCVACGKFALCFVGRLGALTAEDAICVREALPRKGK